MIKEREREEAGWETAQGNLDGSCDSSVDCQAFLIALARRNIDAGNPAIKLPADSSPSHDNTVTLDLIRM